VEDVGAVSQWKHIRQRPQKDRPFFSKVTVTDSMEVVPKRIDTVTTPGSRDRTFSMPPDLMKNIPVHANGKIKPQLTLGGLR